MKRFLHVLSLLVILVGSVDAKGLWVEYEPVTVELTGVIKFESRFGAPGYGEDPKRDARVRICVLKLHAPINVKGSLRDDPNSETVLGVREVQLLSREKMKQFEKNRVRVKGKLFRAHTGHHYTKVMMNVEAVAVILPRK